jgi:hypothetical protein
MQKVTEFDGRRVLEVIIGAWKQGNGDGESRSKALETRLNIFPHPIILQRSCTLTLNSFHLMNYFASIRIIASNKKSYRIHIILYLK